MTKLNFGLASLSAASLVFVSGLGIYFFLNKKDDKFLTEIPNLSKQEEKVVDNQTTTENIEPNPFQENIQLKDEDISQITEIEVEETDPIKGKEESVRSEIFIEKSNLKFKYKNTEFNYSVGHLTLGNGNLVNDLPSETIGFKFSNYFINSPYDSIWDKKLESWKETYNNEYLRKNLSSSFTPRNPSSINKTSLIIKCRNAYGKKSWNHWLIGGKSVISQYWESVANYCAREDVSRPENWYKG